MPNLVRAKAQGRPNWRHVAEEKLERQRQEELQTQLWQWEEEQAQEKRGIVWNLFLAAWQGCADGDVIVRCWETATDVRYSRSMFIGRRMVDRFSIYRQTEVR